MKATKPKSTNPPLKKSKKSTKEPVENPRKKRSLMFINFGVLGIIGGAAAMAAGFLTPGISSFNAVFPEVPSKVTEDSNIYSNLTGLAVKVRKI